MGMSYYLIHPTERLLAIAPPGCVSDVLIYISLLQKGRKIELSERQKRILYFNLFLPSSFDAKE